MVNDSIYIKCSDGERYVTVIRIYINILSTVAGCKGYTSYDAPQDSRVGWGKEEIWAVDCKEIVQIVTTRCQILRLKSIKIGGREVREKEGLTHTCSFKFSLEKPIAIKYVRTLCPLKPPIFVLYKPILISFGRQVTGK